MRVRMLAVIFVALVAPAGAQQSGQIRGPLSEIKGLACTFPAYATARWSGITPEIVTGKQDFSFQITGIDYRRRRAEVVGGGTALASMLLTETGMNIIEQTPVGNLNLTTVFAAGGQGKTFIAVHARHLGDLASAPRSSQAYGTCELTP